MSDSLIGDLNRLNSELLVAQKRIAELDADRREKFDWWSDQCTENQALEARNFELTDALEAAEKRIAELEAENERAEDEIREWKRHR